MSGCALHPGGGYGCKACDRAGVFQSLAQYAAEVRDLRAQRDALAEALGHLHWCRACAEGSWSDCEGGRQAEAALAKVKP